jgi:hypothetical protein
VVGRWKVNTRRLRAYYKERLGWCVVDRCDASATGEVKGLLVCDEHKSDAEGGGMTVIELIDGVPYIYSQGEVI